MTAHTSPYETKTAWLEVMLLWAAGISVAMQFAKFSIAYDALLIHYQEGATLTGAAISVVGVVGLIFGVSAGVIVGRVGYRRSLIGALALGSMMSFLESLMPNFELMMVCRVIEGFSQLGVVVAAPTMIARLSAPQHRSITMGLWGTFFGVAFAISGLFGEMILRHYGMGSLFFAHGLFIGGVACVLFFRLERNNTLYENQSNTQQSKLLAQMSQVYRNPRNILPAAIFLFYTCMFVSLLTYIPRLVEDEHLRSIIRTCLPLMSIAGTFLAGTLSQYLMRPQNVAIMAYSVIAGSAIMLSFFTSAPVLFCILAAVMVLSAGMVTGASMSMIPAIARNPNEQAQTYGLVAQLGNLGSTIGPPSFATMLSLFGVQGLVALVLVFCVCGGGLSLIAKRFKNNSSSL
ncbi:MFS transporter [Marinomonas pollencensis]|uniref:Putative MFS family arabinose efflux permease n=1 Tax=Marinomonas pollencensis TaxID=491954 RepID=A0A3E0DLJ5_9GAMM|nr:MFS transporter [Marinomonas pollencensis]REG83710.1 putative MFS family arabinose efflux permease [Marinomonas pollencensis]